MLPRPINPLKTVKNEAKSGASSPVLTVVNDEAKSAPPGPWPPNGDKR